MKKFSFILSLFAFANAFAAPPTYNFFPPPGMSWTQGLGQFTQNGPSTASSNAGTSSLLGQNSDLTGSGNVVVAIGSVCGITSANALTGWPCVGTGGTVNNATFYLGAGGGIAGQIIFIFDAGGYSGVPAFTSGNAEAGFLSDSGMQFQALGTTMDFYVQNGAGFINHLLFSGDNDSKYFINNTTGLSSDGSWQLINKSTAATGTTNYTINTSNGGANPGLANWGCTSETGTLSANGNGPGAGSPITGAPANQGCAVVWGYTGISNTPFIWARTAYLGGWLASSWDIGKALGGVETIEGSSSGTITLQPQAAAGTYNWNYPTTAGTAGQYLTSQGGTTNAMTWTGLTATSASIGGGALGAGACASTATAVAGAAVGNVVQSTPNTYPGDSAFWKSYVSGANTVTTLICESVAATPTASTYNIRVFQ